MSEQPAWRRKLGRLSAAVQVPFALFGATQGPPPQQAGLPPNPPGVVRRTDVAPRTSVPQQVEELSSHDRRLKKELRERAMADAVRQQTTSQRADPGRGADHGEKRRQRAAETSAGAVPAPARRTDRERKRSDRTR